MHVYVYMCVSVNHKLVRMITHQPFKLGSPNLDQRCKKTLFCGAIDHDLHAKIGLKSSNLPHFEFVRAITHHRLNPEFPNLDPKCILALLSSLLMLGLIDLIFSFTFNFKPVFSPKFCVSYSLASFCIYLVRPSPVSVPHPTWLGTFAVFYACGQGPAMNNELI